MTEEITQEGSSFEPEIKSYSHYKAFLDLITKSAFDEFKRRTIDGHGLQLAQIRQSIYLAITLATASAGVISTTPAWNGAIPGTWQEAVPIMVLAVAFLVSVFAFCFGIYALRGEFGGKVPVPVPSFINLACDAYGPDGQYAATNTQEQLVKSLQESIRAFSKMQASKGRKIRALNLLVQGAAICAALGVCAHFSTTLWSHYAREPRAEETCTGACAVTRTGTETTADRTVP